MDDFDFFDIGIITKVFGIKGEVKVKPETDVLRRFDNLESAKIFLKENKLFELIIDSVRYDKNAVYLRFSGVNTRSKAEALVGGIIRVTRAEAVELEDDEYFRKDLYGLSVFTEEGEELGILSNILETGAADVFAIRSNLKERSRELLIPAIKENIKNVDIKNGRITVYLTPGLREIYW